MGPLNRRIRVGAVVVTVVAIGIAAVAVLRPGGPRTGVTMVDYPTNRAQLTIAVRRTGPDRAELAVTFAPTVPDGHLYGMSMPRTGIDGAGRPTLVELVGPGWTASGPVVASATTTDRVLPGFSAAFPLYPDGPVTLTVPIVRGTQTPTTAPVNVELTFMVCTTAGTCFPPVERAPLEVPTPR